MARDFFLRSFTGVSAMDVLLFSGEDYISVRKYYKFLLQIGYRDVVTHRPQFVPVLALYAKELSDVAKTNLERFNYLTRQTQTLSEEIIGCVNRGEVLHAACRRALLHAPNDRRLLLNTMFCDSFNFTEADNGTCRKYQVTGVIDQVLREYANTLSFVEEFSSKVSSLGQDIHKLFAPVFRTKASEPYPPSTQAPQSICENWFFCGERTTFVTELWESIIEDDLNRKVELDRLVRIYASTSSALLNLGDFLYRIQYFFRTMIKRLSTITPVSRFSTLLLACELLAEVLVGLRVRAEHLGEWSEFESTRTSYGADEE